MDSFFQLVQDQFTYGGVKYAQTETKEATDVLFDDFGFRWLLGGIGKYCKRYQNLARERDLLKIACYMFILWLKRGYHLFEEGSKRPINTTVEVKDRFFSTFKRRVDVSKEYIKLVPNQGVQSIYDILYKMALDDWWLVTEYDIIVIFLLAYDVWQKEIKEKGKDKDTYNEQKES